MVVEQVEVFGMLIAEIVELKVRLAINLRNSSKPLSLDGYAKPASKSCRYARATSLASSSASRAVTSPSSTDPDAMITYAPHGC